MLYVKVFYIFKNVFGVQFDSEGTSVNTDSSSLFTKLIVS